MLVWCACVHLKGETQFLLNWMIHAIVYIRTELRRPDIYRSTTFGMFVCEQCFRKDAKSRRYKNLFRSLSSPRTPFSCALFHLLFISSFSTIQCRAPVIWTDIGEAVYIENQKQLVDWLLSKVNKHFIINNVLIIGYIALVCSSVYLSSLFFNVLTDFTN